MTLLPAPFEWAAAATLLRVSLNGPQLPYIFPLLPVPYATSVSFSAPNQPIASDPPPPPPPIQSNQRPSSYLTCLWQRWTPHSVEPLAPRSFGWCPAGSHCSLRRRAATCRRYDLTIRYAFHYTWTRSSGNGVVRGSCLYTASCRLFCHWIRVSQSLSPQFSLTVFPFFTKAN